MRSLWEFLKEIKKALLAFSQQVGRNQGRVVEVKGRAECFKEGAIICVECCQGNYW